MYFNASRRDELGGQRRGAHGKSSSGIIHTRDMSHVSNVGVGSAANEARPNLNGTSASDVSVGSMEDALAKPSDAQRGRFLALGVLITGVFGTLTAKIWSMQVMSSSTYERDAENNLYTTVSTPAPRGCVYDRAGNIIVGNKSVQCVLAEADAADDADVQKRLAAVLGLPEPIVAARMADSTTGAQGSRTIATDASLRDVAFIAEHADAFPKISIETRTVRSYPYGALCAHALGYTGSPTEDDLDSTIDGRTIESTDTIGKSGIEYTYDNILAGDHGSRKVMVDAEGNVVNVVSETAPSKGSDVCLAIDAYAQYVADSTLASIIAPSGNIGSGEGTAGAVVAIDLETGGVCAMASYPTFDPSHFTNGIPQDVWDLYNTDASHAPLVNRVVNGQYAAASTFKAFTSLAGLYYGFASDSSTWNCAGSWDGFGSGDVQNCWLLTGHGNLDLHDGIVNSCDVVFYEIAKAFYDHGPDGTGELSQTALQEYLQKFNFGSATGVDLEGESVGRVPTPTWKAEQWKNVPSEATWRGGDYSNMIIGQGDVLITPIQLAVAYGAIATGKIIKPHLLQSVKNADGEVVRTVSRTVVSEPEIDAEDLAYVRNALHDMIPHSTVANNAFNEAGIDAAGKSGTAEHTDREDDAWFAAYAPYDNPRYVATCIVEGGGGGADTAAPVVAKVLGALINGGDVSSIGYVQGSSGISVESTTTKTSSGRQD
jgi:penicillin-binding protein 2